MRLNLRLKKVLAGAAVVATIGGALPVMTYAADYDNHWAKSSITKWAEKEIIKGYEDGSFKPNDYVTRGELASIMVRMFGLTDTVGAKTFKDVAENKWYTADIAKVTSAGIMGGYEDGSFKPESQVTRQEAASILARAYKLTAQEGTLSFTDAASIASWAKADVTTLVTKGYLSGDQNNAFRPNAPLTRAEAVTMIDNMTQELINHSGVYTQDVKGNLVVNTVGVELKDMTITGNLYLAEGVEDGKVTLDNVVVLGDVIVRKGSYEKPIRVTGATVVVDGKEVSVPVEDNTVKITVDTDKDITVNGVTFKKGQAISTVTLHEASQLNEMNVAVVGKLGADLKTETAYKLTDLVARATNKVNQERVLKILESFKKELSTAQYNRAVEIVEDLIKEIESFAKNNEAISVDTILNQIARLQDKLQDPDVKSVISKLEKALKLLGIQVDQLGKEEMHAETSLALKAAHKGYALDQLKLEITFQ
ncbi:MAG: S-layer homology domain-containing protein [Cellulosilyticum sp.]|nr:S-layer homology domain-containing protein [Cellulosilyticum sp.]